MHAGARFFDGETARDHAVTLELLPEGLAIEGPAVARRVWSFAGLIAITPMRAGYPLRLGHDAFPGARLVVTQESFARQLVLSAPHLAGAPNLKRAGRLAAIIVACALFAIGVTYGTLSYAPQALAFVLPESWRDNLADQVEATFTGNGKLCGTSADNPLLRILSARLQEDNPEAPPFELKVYDIDILNAFALPGGRIIMTRKLIDAAQAPSEVAGVLAHEIGHVYHRHAEAQLIRAMGIELLLQVISGGGDSISGLAGLLAILRYSRDAEREADGYAQDMLIKAAVDPLGLKRFFEEIKKLEGRQGSGGGLFGAMSDMMSTHPVTDERIAAIKPLPQGVVARPVLSDAEWAGLRQICE
ncbi:M48 family metallopeptidase [Nordella sp. HKS 07]|uniref:M48 family metallopeptidase n=1 Tax=Nordella sp. HKS 07 TaxID=2712222 RepID=UPI0013E1BA69|nr:M48 family metallopeptidase [Nordella sp. HKS 07]QIG51222.1 M48 family metallopeptidase [Nordella sp. HKS 07]